MRAPDRLPVERFADADYGSPLLRARYDPPSEMFALSNG